MSKHKNKNKESENRQTWVGLFPRKTKTLTEKKNAELKKSKQKGYDY